MLFCYSQKLLENAWWSVLKNCGACLLSPQTNRFMTILHTSCLSEMRENMSRNQCHFMHVIYALDINIGYASDLMHQYAWISLFDPYYAKPLYSFSSGEQVCVCMRSVFAGMCVSVCGLWEKHCDQPGADFYCNDLLKNRFLFRPLAFRSSQPRHAPPRHLLTSWRFLTSVMWWINLRSLGL